MTTEHTTHNKFSPLFNTLFNSISLCLVETPWWLAMLALVITGPLLGFYSVAATMLMIGSVVAMTIVSFGSSWRGAIWIPQDVPCAILAIIVAQMIASAAPQINTASLFMTVVVFIAMATILTGVLFYFLGYFRLGNFVRYLPFPVVAGFLGGTGWLLLKAGVDVSLGELVSEGYWHFDAIIRWLPALLLAVLIWWLSARITSPLLLPGLVLATIIVFHQLIALFGLSSADMASAGWMFTALLPGTEAARGPAVEWSSIASIEWSLILTHSSGLLLLAAGSIISMMLNNSGFELQVNDDFDVNRDLRVTGAANIAGGLCGGWPGYVSPASSWINARQRQQLPFTGFLVAVGVAATIWFALPLLAQVPLFVLGSVVAYIGLLFVVDWVIDSYRRLTRTEYLILLAIVAVIAMFGLAQGVVLGLLLAVALFVVTFSRLDVVRHQLTGTHARARVKRSSAQQEHLQATGSATQLFQLQGYLFFGTANRLVERVKNTTANTECRFVVLDFERVSGVDSTAISSFLKLYRHAAKKHASLLFVALDEATQHLLSQQLQADSGVVQYYASLDDALEWAEQQQLVAASLEHDTAGLKLQTYLQALSIEPAASDSLLQRLDRIELRAGEYMIRQHETATELFFIEQGSVTAQLEKPDGSRVRLETINVGVVGELAFYLGNKRTAAVVCDNDVTAYRLTRERLKLMTEQHPKDTVTLHLVLAKLLSERTSHLVSQVAALQK